MARKREKGKKEDCANKITEIQAHKYLLIFIVRHIYYHILLFLPVKTDGDRLHIRFASDTVKKEYKWQLALRGNLCFMRG